MPQSINPFPAFIPRLNLCPIPIQIPIQGRGCSTGRFVRRSELSDQIWNMRAEDSNRYRKNFPIELRSIRNRTKSLKSTVELSLDVQLVDQLKIGVLRSDLSVGYTNRHRKIFSTELWSILVGVGRNRQSQQLCFRSKWSTLSWLYKKSKLENKNYISILNI